MTKFQKVIILLVNSVFRRPLYIVSKTLIFADEVFFFYFACARLLRFTTFGFKFLIGLGKIKI